MICAHCHYQVDERDAVFNDDMPALPFHEDCYEEHYCECGNRAWDESGLCLDCKSEAEVSA